MTEEKRDLQKEFFDTFDHFVSIQKISISRIRHYNVIIRALVGNLYKEVKDPNLIAKISGHVENSRAFSRYRDIDEEMAKEVILKLE